ncbi:MAG: hypothetical protein OEZ22_06460 [Spirochaetia bacterium]|nr:hypothetical protein [Spirochaetia bacterium]
MLFSHHTAGKHVKKKSNAEKLFNFIFWIIIISSFIYGVQYLYNQKDRILFNFQKDRYSEIENKLISLSENLKTSEIENKDEIKNLSNLLSALLKDHEDDGYLYFLYGKLYFILFNKPFHYNDNLYRNFLFNLYLEKNDFYDRLNKDYWSKALIYFRKSMLLTIPESYIETAKENLSFLYFWGGRPYWKAGYELIKENISKKFTFDMYNIFLLEDTPDWEKLNADFDSDHINLWQSFYYLNTKNTPLAFSKLNKLALSENINLRNMAQYLLGYLAGKQNKMKTQFHFYSMINLETFLPQNKWFLQEYYIVIRFLGYEKLAAQVLKNYEPMVLSKSK